MKRVMVLVVLATTLVACGREGMGPGSRPQSTIFGRVPVPGDAPEITLPDPSGPTEMVNGRAIFVRGASTGWHEHPGPGFVQVAAGRLTMFDADCNEKTFGKGEGFVDPPGTPLLARNDGGENVVLYFTFFLPSGAELSSPRPAPAACDAA